MGKTSRYERLAKGLGSIAIGAASLAWAAPADAQQPYYPQPQPYPYPPPTYPQQPYPQQPYPQPYPQPYGQPYPPPYVAPAAPPLAPYVIDDWDPDAATPPGYNRITHANSKLISGGIALFGSAWFISALTGAVALGDDQTSSSDRSAWTPLFIPVAGPFIALKTLKPNTVGTGTLLADGILQSAGLLSIVVGASEERVKLIRYDANAPVPASGHATDGGTRGPLLVTGTVAMGLGVVSLFAAGISAMIGGTAAAQLESECPNRQCFEESKGGDDLKTARAGIGAAKVLTAVAFPTMGAGLALLILGAGANGGHHSSVSAGFAPNNAGAGGFLRGSF